MRTPAAGAWLAVAVPLAACVALVGCAAPRVFKASNSPLPSQSAQPPSDGDPASLAPQPSSSGPAGSPAPASSTSAASPPPSASISQKPSGVSGVPPVGSHASATVKGKLVVCPDPAAVGGVGGGAVTPLLASADVVAVVRCETVTRAYAGVGTWTVQLAEVADSGLSGFVDQLRQPSDPPSAGVACPDFRMAIPWFVVIANDGTVVRASIPTTGCGQPKTPVISALSALPFHDVAAVRVQQISASGG